MSHDINIKDDEVYVDMAAAFQCVELARLNAVLKAHGISDQELRRNICTAYIVDTGEFLDTGWFTVAGTTVFPQICFAEQTQDEEEVIGEIETLYVNSDDFSFHEYAHGAVNWFFDEQNEDISGLEQGVI